jgi:hypothetical protein
MLNTHIHHLTKFKINSAFKSISEVGIHAEKPFIYVKPTLGRSMISRKAKLELIFTTWGRDESQSLWICS